MTSVQQKGLQKSLFVCSCFLGGWGGAVHAFDLTSKCYLDRQLGFKSNAHKHKQNQKEKIFNYFCLKHSAQITGKNPVYPHPTPTPPADHLMTS